jgi:hypothetical protein
MEKTEKQFPNGFASWQETHFEVVCAIDLARQSVLYITTDKKGVVEQTLETQGSGGLYELAERLTDEFETLNAGRLWDGEFFEEIWDFLSEKNL